MTDQNTRSSASTKQLQRRFAREFTLKGLYQWKLTKYSPDMIMQQLNDDPDYSQMDQIYFRKAFCSIIENIEALHTQLGPLLDREIDIVDPVEYAILLLASYELIYQPSVPYRVAINEAIELAKKFGGSEKSHRYVNGILDRLAQTVRPEEVAQKRRASAKNKKA